MKKYFFFPFFLLTTFINAQSYSGGTGTQTDPYLISSKSDMETLSNVVNSGNDYTGKYFLLTNDLTGITTVIGDLNSHPFKGNFDGGNNTIEINISTNTYSGVFGQIIGSKIENLNVKGTISSGSYYLGSICGYATNSSIINCHSSVNISTSTQWVGGICGYATYSTIIAKCSNTGNIINSSTSTYTGGICGGTGSGSITNCYNTGDISSTSTNSSSYAAGISNTNAPTITNSPEIINCYNTGNISSSAYGYNYAIYVYNPAYATGICNSTVRISNCFSANNIITCESEGGNIATGRISNQAGQSGFEQRVLNSYSLPSMLINGSPASSLDNKSKEGADILLSSFQSQQWIENNLQWDFNEIWEMSDINSIYNGLPIFKSKYNNVITNIKYVDNTNDIIIYTNSNDQLYITSDYPIKRVEIYNQQGSLLMIEPNFMEKIDVSSLSKGIYLVSIYVENRIITKKIIIK